MTPVTFDPGTPEGDRSLPTVTVTKWLDCKTCGTPFLRARSFVGPDREAEAEAWQPDPRCAACVFGFGGEG